jgi:plasmid stability protein
MPVNLSIKNAPDELAQRLKARARRHHRSLQGEMMVILESAVQEPEPMTPAQVLDRLRELNLSSPSEAAEIVREDRDGR